MADFPGLLTAGQDATYVFGNTAPVFEQPLQIVIPSATTIGALIAGSLAPNPSPTPSFGAENHNGTLADNACSPGLDWFERVHVIPRTPIDFGNIITTVSQTFEIFNAYRRTAIQFVSYTNNAGVGITIPDLPVIPTTMQPLTSFLDPTSIRLAPVRMEVSALKDGVPSFDDTLDFGFTPGGIVFLRVKGLRIILLVSEFDGDVDESLEFLTDVHSAESGKEKRPSLRKNPRQFFDVQFEVFGRERRILENQLFDWQDKAFGLPLWHERTVLTSAVSIGATSLNVRDISNADFRTLSLVAIFTDERTFDVLVVSAKTSTTITLQSATLNAYPVGTWVMPVRIVAAEQTIRGRRPPKTQETIVARFRVLDNDTGAPTGSTAGWSTFGSKVLLDRVYMDGTEIDGSYERKLVIADSRTGIIVQSAPWDRHKHGFPVGFRVNTRADKWKLRQLFLALRGRQTSLWCPTFFDDDLVVTQNLASGTNTMRIELVGYSKFVKSRQPKSTFKITFTDGSSLVRTITAATEFSTTEETLTLDANWPSTKLVSEVSTIQFYEMIRFDSDTVQFRHTGIERARVTIPAKVVFDT